MPRLQLGLLHRRECLLPTFRGWLVIFLVLAASAIGFVRGAYPFLAVQESVPGGVLVVEGWAPDYALAECLAEFRQHRYEGIFVTGVPLDTGVPLSEYKTSAQLSAAILEKMGADPQTIHAVPGPEFVQDRTYGMAVTLRDHLRKLGIKSDTVNIVTVGPHARRTRLLFQEAFGPATRIGMIAVVPRDFDSARWWRSSQGFRVVSGEAIAYLYARCFFRPKA